VRRARTLVKNGMALPARPHQLKLGQLSVSEEIILDDLHALINVKHVGVVLSGSNSNVESRTLRISDIEQD